MYTALARRCTRSVHAVNGRVHGTYNAVHKTAVFTVHDRVRAAYTAVIGLRTDHVRGPCTAVYTVCTRPCAAVYTGRKHGRGRTMNTAVARRCTRSVHAVDGRVQTVHSRPRPCTNCVHDRTRAIHIVRPCPKHGRVRSRYVAKHGRVRGPYPTVYVPYTWPCTGRVPCTRPSLRPVCTAVYVPCTKPCMVRP